VRDPRRFIAVALAFSSLASNAALAAGDDASIADHTRRSTAVVTARVTPESEAVGAGVILAVSPNVIVLTAGHLAARKNLALWTFAGEQLRIVAEYRVADRDLALIVASGACKGCEAAETADAILAGAPVHVWGNPLGRRYVKSSGTIADLHPVIPGFATNGRFALACDGCDVGDSGGGVFDQRGRLLGVVTEGWDGGKGPKRVIAEPANHALAGMPLEYLARVETAAPQTQAAALSVRRLPAGEHADAVRVAKTLFEVTCGDSEKLSVAIALSLSASIAGRAMSERELTRETHRATKDAAHECAAAARSALRAAVR
jgi:Trypsin-like peptidase domain